MRQRILLSPTQRNFPISLFGCRCNLNFQVLPSGLCTFTQAKNSLPKFRTIKFRKPFSFRFSLARNLNEQVSPFDRFYGPEMKKTLISTSVPKSRQFGDGKCRKRRNHEIKNKRPRRRTFYDLISSIWPLAFLFYFRVCLGHGNGDYLFPPNNDTLATEPAAIRASDVTDNAPVELNFSINVNVTTNRGYKTLSTSCSVPGKSKVEDLAYYILGHTALVCHAPVQLEVLAPEQRRLESQHNEREKALDGYLDLDEFRNINRQEKKTGELNQRINITHRVELDGSGYNYASSAKGAKLVAHNKEAKGAENILGKDHDKYLINPCSVFGKFVVVELAEETLVDSVKIANFEHHSSNFKEFEIRGSLTYPTENWSFLGKFAAANVKQAQAFALPEPDWVRYLNLTLLSHYGYEHYCTLSVFEVYGIDAIEWMLQDLLVAREENKTMVGPVDLEVPKSGESEVSSESSGKGFEKIDDGKIVSIDDVVSEVRPKARNRIPGDTVLKILMQKVRSLELNLSLLEEYLRESRRRQGDVLPHLNKAILRISESIENERKEIKKLLEWKGNLVKEMEDMELWKTIVSSQMGKLMNENRKLRSEVENVAANQSTLESREFAVLAINLFFMCVAFLMLVSRRFCTSFGGLGRGGPNEAARMRKGWMVILVSSCLTMLVGLLSV